MTETVLENQVQQQQVAQQTDKEMNFRRLEAKYQQELAAERAKREEVEKKLADFARKPEETEEDDAQEPFVDHKKLKKTLSNFNQLTQSEIHKAMEQSRKSVKEEIKREMWLENNPDFMEVLSKAEEFAQKMPKVAETILRMPDTFERQQLVYQAIKEMGIDKPVQAKSGVQEKIDANRQSPYYQPSGVSTAPYNNASDFSQNGQKQAYDKMKELQAKLRLR